MPAESRILGFNQNEALEVLRKYRTHTGRNLPG